jgi:hypothetical protein
VKRRAPGPESHGVTVHTVLRSAIPINNGYVTVSVNFVL